jgi:hypothetical protein
MVIDPRACSDGDAVHAMTPDGPANLICKEGAPYPWTGARFDYDHDDLTDVVRLVPARKVTRQDLPDFTGMLKMLDDMLDGWPLSKSSTLVEDTLAHVIGHLNDRGGLPDDRVRIVTGGREPRFVTEAHARLEAERDGAAARAIAAEVRAEKAEKESGHARSLQQLAVERADKAEQLIPAYAMLDIWTALSRDSIHFDDWHDEHGYADAWAELTAAVREARTAPAVDRDLVEAAIAEGLHRGLTVDQLARSVCAAINGEPAPDPVEELAGEIDGAVRDAVRKGFDFIDSVTGIEVDQKVVDAMLTWLPSESRALARRAFGQEARDGVDR